MQHLTYKNRRFLALSWQQPNLNFALWRQRIGNLLAQSGKLQRVDESFYVEFEDKSISVNLLAGVNVIGMEPALPHDGIQFYDYGPMSWDRVELPAEFPRQIDQLAALCAPLIARYPYAYTRLRICQKDNWQGDKLNIVNYLDFLRV